MNELMLRELLGRAGDAEPPTGLRAQNVCAWGPGCAGDASYGPRCRR